MCPACRMKRYEALRKIRASVNFAGLDGSYLPRCSQSHAKIGAKMMTQSGSTDWNQLDGNVKPNSVSCVARSAKRLRVVPACSYPAQKIVVKRKRMPITE